MARSRLTHKRHQLVDIALCCLWHLIMEPVTIALWAATMRLHAANWEDTMIRSSLATTFAAAAALSGLLFVASSISPARAAEIKLLGPVSLRVVLPGLLPQFEKSSGHKVTRLRHARRHHRSPCQGRDRRRGDGFARTK